MSERWLSLRTHRQPVSHPEPQDGAASKLLHRIDELVSAGWTDRDLWELDPTDQLWGRHGLVYRLRPEWTLGQITRCWVEILGSRDANGDRGSMRSWRVDPPWVRRVA